MARKTVRQQTTDVNITFAFMGEDGAIKPRHAGKKGCYIRRDQHFGALRFCTLCNKPVSVKLFRLAQTTKDGLSGQCQPCVRKRKRQRYASSAVERAKMADTARKKTYGLLPEQFVAMLERQGHKCAVCKDPLQPGKHTHVDHCHTTGKVRELLCRACNLTVGHLEGKASRLPGVVAYLARYRT